MQRKKLKNLTLKTAAFLLFCGALCGAGSVAPSFENAQAESGIAPSALPFDGGDLFPSTTVEGGFSDTHAASQEKYLYSRIGLQKDGVSVRDVTKGATDAHRSRVVVIDSGVKYDHEDFLAADGSIRFSPLSYNVTMKKTVAEAGYEILADSEIVGGHGTQVCGQIFAVGDNGVGIAGLAEDVELIFVKVTPTSQGGYDGYEMLEAMEYAATLNADVVNMSLGNFLTSNPYSSVLRRIRNSGAVIVSAAGNVSKSDLHYPSADSSVIGVGAFTNLLNYSSTATEYPLASYSTFGDKNVQVCAPGGFYSTTMDGGYAYANGTSLATPIVTSAVALYRSLYPESTVEEVEAALYASATDQGDYGKDYKFGYGGLNIYDFLFGKTGQVTFDFGGGNEQTRTVKEGHALQEYPFPTVGNIPTGKEFGGWYLDKAYTKPLTYYKQVLPIGTRVYAKWQNIGADGLSTGSANGCGALDYTFTKSGNIAIKGYHGCGERLILPKNLTVDGKSHSITEIAAKALQGHKTLKKIVLPTTVTTIREYAFADDYEYVYLPSSVTTVEKYAFRNSSGTLYMESETGADGFAFGWNEGADLTNVLRVGQVKVEDGLELVLIDGKYTLLTYEGADRYVSLDLEYPVTTIAPQAFERNTRVETVYAPDVLSIGERAFYGCTGLTDVQFSSVESIGASAFYGCAALTDLQFPASLRVIENSAFAGNEALIRFSIPAGSVLERIGDYAFEDCLSLEGVDLHNAQALTYVGLNAFADAKNAFVLYIPDNVQTIGYNAFGGMQSLTSARLPFLGRGRTDTYTHFGYTFGASNIDLQSAVVPANLQYLFVGGDVQDGAFKGMSGLTVFVAGNCSEVDGLTVFSGGRYAFIQIYAQDLLIGMLGGKANSELPTSTLNSAFRAPKGYASAGWSGADVSVFPAEGTHVWTLDTQAESYEIVFCDEAGNVLSTQTLGYGERAVEPALPQKPTTAQYEYVFIGWDRPLTPAVENAVYTAVYQAVARSYTVRFYSDDGTLLSQDVYLYGEMPIAPIVSDRPMDNTYYEKFVGWDHEVALTQEDAEYHARFEKTYVEYKIRFLYEDGTSFFEKTYHYGEEISAPNTDREQNVAYRYEFIGWKEPFSTVTCDADYTALYREILREYTVVFVDYDGKEISRATVAYGEIPAIPTPPERAEEGGFRYEFIGWDTEVVAVFGDATYTAAYKAVSTKITVKFVNYDGSLLSEAEYDKGATVIQPNTPTRTVDSKTYYYEFAGWDKDVTSATENVTYKATYERKYYEYTIRFADYDGSVISEDVYRYGASVTVPANPSREGYTFVGWNPEIAKAEKDVVYTAVYEKLSGGGGSGDDSSGGNTNSGDDSSSGGNSSGNNDSSDSSNADSSTGDSSTGAFDSSSIVPPSVQDSPKKSGCNGTVGGVGVCCMLFAALIFCCKKEE